MRHKNISKKGSLRWFIVFLVGFLVVAGIIVFSGMTRTSGNVVQGNDQKDVQKITLSFNGGYSPNTIRVREGIPVEITLDNSVKGCFRSLVIRDLGVSESSASPSDTIRFTPTKTGSFKFSCSMGMATGTIVVE